MTLGECYNAGVDAAERKRRREATWSARVFRGDALSEMEGDALDEWQRLSPLERLALTLVAQRRAIRGCR